MSATSITSDQKSNRGTDRSVGRFTTTGRSISALLRRARLLWASKVALELAARTGMSVRAAERWLAGDRAMSGEAVVALLQSDKGVAFLDALIEDMPDAAQRRWREEFERAARRADLRARREALEREIEEQEARSGKAATGSQGDWARTAEGRTGTR